MNKIGEDIFEYYMEVRRADVLAQSTYLRERKLKNLDDIEILYAKIKEAKQCVSLKELAVSGSDLIAIGIKPGKEIGEICRHQSDTRWYPACAFGYGSGCDS